MAFSPADGVESADPHRGRWNTQRAALGAGIASPEITVGSLAQVTGGWVRPIESARSWNGRSILSENGERRRSGSGNVSGAFVSPVAVSCHDRKRCGAVADQQGTTVELTE